MTVWEVSIYSVWNGIVCSETLSAPVRVHRRHHFGCWQTSPGGCPVPWVGGLPPDRSQQKKACFHIHHSRAKSSILILPMRSQCWISVGWRCRHMLPSADSAELRGPWGLAAVGALLSALCGNKLIDICLHAVKHNTVMFKNTPASWIKCIFKHACVFFWRGRGFG